MSDFQKYLDEELPKVSFDMEIDDIEDLDYLNNNIKEELAYIISTARKKEHLSQKDLSRITGIQQSSISKIESGNYNPSILMIQRIAFGLGKKLIIRLE